MNTWRNKIPHNHIKRLKLVALLYYILFRGLKFRTIYVELWNIFYRWLISLTNIIPHIKIKCGILRNINIKNGITNENKLI